MDREFLQTPFLDHLGARVVHWDKDGVEVELTVQPFHANLQGIVHGGVLATLLDTACGYSGIYADERRDVTGASTISLTINYLSKASIDDVLTVRGWRTGGGRRIFFAQAEIGTRDGATVATASGAFRYNTQR